MIKVLKHLNGKDKKALAAFVGLALLCFLYFASGILVTYVSSPDSSMELAQRGKGFVVRVLGIQTEASATRLSAALQDQRRVPVVVEPSPLNQGYTIKVGPLANRVDAENLTNDLHNSGYDKLIIVESCAPGTPDCDPDGQDPFLSK